jgi:hypothetical protein
VIASRIGLWGGAALIALSITLLVWQGRTSSNVAGVARTQSYEQAELLRYNACIFHRREFFADAERAWFDGLMVIEDDNSFHSFAQFRARRRVIYAKRAKALQTYDSIHCKLNLTGAPPNPNESDSQ